MAGLMALPAEARAMSAPPSWLTYVGTPDIDATVRAAIRLGGKVIKSATDIPTVGRFAVLQDPQGAVFAVFTPQQAPAGASGTTPSLGDFSWHELATTDWAGAFEFYHQLFGWEKTESMEMGPAGTYQMFGWPRKTVGGMFTKPREAQGPAFWLPYIRVRDAKKTADAVKKHGGHIINGPHEVPGGDLIAQATDLQGTVFAVHSQKSPGATATAPAATPSRNRATRKRAAPRKAARQKPVRKRAAPRKAARQKTAQKPASGKRASPKRVSKAAGRKGVSKRAARPRSKASKKSRKPKKRSR